MNIYQTLHCHTIASDGLLTHSQVLDICSKNNIGVVAFTDHDSMPSASIVKKLKSSKSKANWIIGIEISSGKPSDFDMNFSPHIVGLFVDPFNKNLVKHCKLAKEARIERMARMVKSLNKLGFNITEQDCLDASGGETVGRPHIVKAINSKQENESIIENLRKKMEEDVKKDNKLKEKYNYMIKMGKNSYPYTLFLSDDSYIKGVYVDYLYRVDLDGCVKLIRDAGGVAVFAHWFTEIEKCDESKMEMLLKEDRLDGVETVYGFYDDIRNDFIKQRKVLKRMVEKYQKLEGGGIDAHTLQHLEEFSKDEWYAGLTVGMVEKIIASGKVDKKWSSFK